MRSTLGERLRQIRIELYGDCGGPKIAHQLGITFRSWYNYELGVTIPGDLHLRFIESISVNPLWLFHRQGERFMSDRPALLSKVTPQQLDETPSPAPVADQKPIDSDKFVDKFIQQVRGSIENGDLHVTWKLKKRDGRKDSDSLLKHPKNSISLSHYRHLGRDQSCGTESVLSNIDRVTHLAVDHLSTHGACGTSVWQVIGQSFSNISIRPARPTNRCSRLPAEWYLILHLA